MSTKQFEGQHDDETVVQVFRQYPIVMRRGIIYLGLFWIGGLLPYSFYFYTTWATWVLIAGLVLGVLAVFYQWIGWYFTIHIVTDQRLLQIVQKGLFKRSVSDIGLEKILSVNYQVAGIQQTLLGFGTIVVQTYVGDLILEYIHRPALIQSDIVKVIKENGYNYRGEEAQISERTKAQED